MDHLVYRPEYSSPAAPQPRSLFTVDEFVELPEFNYLTTGALRHLLYNAKPRYSASGEMIAGNGLVEAGAIVRIGRKILIDAAKFREWVSAQRELAVKV
jgi:hypothetical protein